MLLLLAAADTEPLPPQTPQPREDIVIRTPDSTSTIGRNEAGDLIWDIPLSAPRNRHNSSNGGGSWPIIVAPEINMPDNGYSPPPNPRPTPLPAPNPWVRPRPDP